MKSIFLGCVLFLSVTVANSQDFETIMKQPTLMDLPDCKPLINNYKKNKECFRPFIIIAECRFKTNKLIFTETNKQKYSNEQLKEMFMAEFQKCSEDYVGS